MEGTNNVFVNGRVHVRRTQCSTCIFRPGNLMHLEEGRVEQMVADATEDDLGCIPCHHHLGEDIEPVCRGFYDRHATFGLRLAESMGLIEWVSEMDQSSRVRTHRRNGRNTMAQITERKLLAGSRALLKLAACEDWEDTASTNDLPSAQQLTTWANKLARMANPEAGAELGEDVETETEFDASEQQVADDAEREPVEIEITT